MGQTGLSQWEPLLQSGQNKQGGGQSQAQASEILLELFCTHISVRERLPSQVSVCKNLNLHIFLNNEQEQNKKQKKFANESSLLNVMSQQILVLGTEKCIEIEWWRLWENKQNVGQL